MRTSFIILIGAFVTATLVGEVSAFPAKNALALTVTEDGLVLEGADLVTPDLDNWEVSWPAVLNDKTTAPIDEIVVEKRWPYTTTSEWIHYGVYSFEKREISNHSAPPFYTRVQPEWERRMLVYKNGELISSKLLDSHQIRNTMQNFATLKIYLTQAGIVTIENYYAGDQRFANPSTYQEIMTLYEESEEAIKFNFGIKSNFPTINLAPRFSNTKKLYSFYPLIADSEGRKLIGVYGIDAGIYSCSSSNLIFTPIDNQRALLPDPSTMTSRPDAIVDDGADAIIFEKRVYTKDNGQTWTYYDTPLPADYLSYDEGYFEYVTLPTEENGLTHPVRKRSADKGATWEEATNNLEQGDYSLQTTWDEETQTTTVGISHPRMFISPIYLEDWWVLDVHTFQDTFVVLLKHANDRDREHQLLCLPVDNSPLSSIGYPEQMLWDGHWQVEAVREPKVRLTEEDADSAELLDLSYENLAQIHLGYPTGRVENVIYGEADIVSYPWVYSYELGWHAYFTSNDVAIPGAFLWTPEESWLFTCVGYYPFLWSFVEENWIWVDVGEGRTRQWYLYQGDGNWIQVR